MKLNGKEGKLTILPQYVRILCIITLFLLAFSALVELWVMISPWVQGRAFPAILEGYQEGMPDLRQYTVLSTPPLYLATMLLDFLSFIPYYIALLFAAFLFFHFFRGKVWTENNIIILKTISMLIIFDATFPTIKDCIQVLLFSLNGERILHISMGVSAFSIRSFIIGFSVYVFSTVIEKAKNIDDEIQLIV